MKPTTLSAIAAAAIALTSATLAVADPMTGKPLAPSDAAGAWTLENDGRSLCVLDLGPDKTGPGYRVKGGASCQDSLPATPAAWSPTDHGMALLGSDGRTLMTFSRWSDSLLVSPIQGQESLQLRRGR